LNLNPKNSSFSNGLPVYQQEFLSGVGSGHLRSLNQNLASLELRFTKQELMSYTELRLAGISKASIPWVKRSSLIFWNVTKGVISKERCDALRQHLSARYTDHYAPRKVLNFSKAFLKYLGQTHFDQRFQAYDLFLQAPKCLKTQKHVTDRIVTKTDVENLLDAIKTAFEGGEIDDGHYLNFRAIVLFGAFTGQRSQATIARLTVGQFRAAVNQQKPVVDVLPQQDKIRMQHYCPLHPDVAEAVELLLGGRRNEEPIFEQLSFARWLRNAEFHLRTEISGSGRVI